MIDAEQRVDLTGYSINFEAEDDDYNQIRQLADEVVIEAGERIYVPTGESLTDVPPADIVDIVELDRPYTGEVLRNDGSDVVAILDPEGNVVASASGSDSPFLGGDPPEDQTVEVTVLDADTGEPIPHAWIDGICSDADSSADYGVINEVNEDGVVTVSLPPADTVSGCHLNARAEGYEMSDELGIDLEDPKNQTVELAPIETDETDDGVEGDESGDTDDTGDDEPSEGTTDTDGDGTDAYESPSNESAAPDGSDVRLPASVTALPAESSPISQRGGICS